MGFHSDLMGLYSDLMGLYKGKMASFPLIQVVWPGPGVVGKPIHRKIPEGVIVDPMGTQLTFTAFEEHGELPKWLLGGKNRSVWYLACLKFPVNGWMD